MTLGVIIIDLVIPVSRSLKSKRSRIKPLLTRLQKEFNVSTAELDKQEMWNQAVIGCAMLSNDKGFINAALSKIPLFIQNKFPDIEIIDCSIQFL